jgi:DNA-directed RNA polymerase subunit RPC12/RpoP
MSVEIGKCPSCGGPLLLDSSKEKATCKYCGHEIIIQQAVQKLKIDGIAGFDTKMLKAQQALEYDNDTDKAAKYYREALELKPNDYKALWGAFLCEIDAITYANNRRGYVQVPGDIPQNTQNAINRFGNRAYSNAPDEVKPYYQSQIQNIQNRLMRQPETKEKKGCYIATAVYGSYDCPEVWVLRRYRDYDLDKNIFGKLFIRIYYAISPTVVKLFGKKEWFNKFWKKRLDNKVLRLKNKGYEDTPYDDLM